MLVLIVRGLSRGTALPPERGDASAPRLGGRGQLVEQVLAQRHDARVVEGDDGMEMLGCLLRRSVDAFLRRPLRAVVLGGALPLLAHGGGLMPGWRAGRATESRRTESSVRTSHARTSCLRSSLFVSTTCWGGRALSRPSAGRPLSSLTKINVREHRITRMRSRYAAVTTGSSPAEAS